MSLPQTVEAFQGAAWKDVLPYYEELAARPLDAASVEGWLQDWSHFESLLSEASALANFAYSCDTTDAVREEAQLRFGSQIAPRAHEQRVKLQGRLVELGVVPSGLETTIRRFRNQMELFDEANVPLFVELAKLITEWAKVNGKLTVSWDGEEKTPAQLLPFLVSTDRAVRERAFRLRAQPYLEQRDVLAGIFDRMYDLRQHIAKNVGFANYRDFAHRDKNRFEYTPEDCMRFHVAVEEAVLSAVERINARRRRHMGLDALRPWDMSVDPEGREPLRPFEDIATFIDRAGAIFAHVDPDFRDYYKAIENAKLLDLENRKGKAPGAYCSTLAFRKLPLIFMNAVGVDSDVRTLLHESGHAFHSLEAASLPLLFQRLEGIIQFFPHCASVDAFQHWIYLDEAGRDADARDQKWLDLRRRFEGNSVDWSGLDAERIARWYQQPHFFGSPFYYIEYGIAELGALQVWRNSLKDPKEAVRKYREAMALGATQPLPELFKAAGARLIFDGEGMRELISVVEGELARLEG